jgi:hypothetical protein
MTVGPPVSETGAYAGSATSAREPPRRLVVLALRRALGRARLRVGRLKARLPAHLEHDHLCRALRFLTRSDPDQMPVHLVSFLCMKGARGALTQRAPRAKSEISCAVAVSKPTTSSIPGSAGSAIEKPFETMPTTTSRASMPDARR